MFDILFEKNKIPVCLFGIEFICIPNYIQLLTKIMYLIHYQKSNELVQNDKNNHFS